MAKKENKKYVYGVTLYYHTNCEVIVESDVPLDRNDAIDAAYSKVGSQKYQEQLIEGLQDDSDADVATYDVNDYVFDRNGKLIEVGNHVMWHDEEADTHYVGQVFKATGDIVSVKASWGSECELLPSECTLVEV